MNTQREIAQLWIYITRPGRAAVCCTKRLILIQIDHTFIYTRNGEKGINPNMCNCVHTHLVSRAIPAC